MGRQTQYIKQRHLGLVQDQAPEEVPADTWTRVVNCSFPDGVSKRKDGYSVFADPLPADQYPFYAGNVDGLDGRIFWVWMTINKVWATDGTTHWDITPTAGLNDTTPGVWTFTVLGGIPVFNNPDNPPMYWDLNTGNPAEVLPGWPANSTCQSIRALKYHLVALNITEANINYPNQVWWSDAAQAGAVPGEWIPTASNSAGDSIIGDSVGAIVDGYPLRDTLTIYKNSATYTMQYVAGQYVFAFRKLFPNIGLAAANCVCEMEGQQIAFTGEDVIIHDGQNYQSLVDDRVQRTLVESVDKLQIRLCTVVAKIVDRQVWVCIPVAGEEYLSIAYVINISDGNIGLITLPNIASVARGTIDPSGADAQEIWEDDGEKWDLDTTIWTQSTFSPTNDSLLMCHTGSATDTPYLFANDVGASANGEGIDATLERLSMRIGNDIHHSVVTQVAPQFTAPDGTSIAIRVGSQNYFNDPISWKPFQEFVVGRDKAVSQIIDGRYISIRFRSRSSNAWKLHSYYLKVKEAGEY